MPPFELFPFRFYDPIRGRWVQARSVATREDIAARHERWQITGPAEAREGAAGGASAIARGPRER